MSQSIFDAARMGDIEALRAHLKRHPDLAASNENGFTPLHCAAMGLNALDEARGLAVIDALIQAGSPLEAPSKDGRTALYLAAEFSQSLAPVQRLLDAGAQADVCSSYGVHVVANAMLPEVQALLSAVTGVPIPPPPVELKSIKLSAAEWRAAKVHVDRVFDQLTQQKIVALQDAGTTQDDGFADCSEVFRERGGLDAGLIGFCFYTRQDLNRAKRSSQLSLGFWGAPDGADKPTQVLADKIVDAFRQNGFIVDWSGSPRIRPTVYLQNIGTSHKS